LLISTLGPPAIASLNRNPPYLHPLGFQSRGSGSLKGGLIVGLLADIRRCVKLAQMCSSRRARQFKRLEASFHLTKSVLGAQSTTSLPGASALFGKGGICGDPDRDRGQ